jgi:hypothetical protein
MIAARTVLPLILRHLLQVFELDLSAYPFLLFLNRLLDPVNELFLQTLQLLLMVVLRLLEQR